jgi:flagellar hook assembly protein FlgD
VTLRVFDVEGGLVRTLVDGRRPAGRNVVTWDGVNDNGTQVASGVYFYRLRTPGYAKTRKMVLLK